MKKVLLVLSLMIVSQAHTQILLEEAKVNLHPLRVDQVSNSLNFTLPEAKHAEFQKNALDFVKRNFDIEAVAKENRARGFSAFEVSFRSSNGNLLARFDRNGTLKSSRQQFKNVLLPEEIRYHLYQEFNSQRMISNKYLAYSKGWDLKKEVYQIKITDGTKTRRLRFEKSSKDNRFASL